MIDRTHRFHGHGSLRFVYQKGQTVRGSYSALRFVKNMRREKYRLAVVVSKKVNKSAVVRNRIRRRVYEAARVCLQDINSPCDLVFTIYSDALASVEPEVLQKSVCGQFERAGILKSSPDHE